MGGAYYIPHELVTNILLRLSDPRDVARFRTVNKQWLRLLTDSSFLHRIVWFDRAMDDGDKNWDAFHVMVTNRIPPVDHLLLYSSLLKCEVESSSSPPIPISSKPPDQTGSTSLEYLLAPEIPGRTDSWFSVDLAGCCDGIFCMHFVSNIILWNPSTWEIKIVPRFAHPGHEGQFCIEQIGFGFDSSTRDYKVVASFVDHTNWDQILTGVYSLRNDSWRYYRNEKHYTNSLPQFPVAQSHRSRYERVHWWTTNGSPDIGIVSFDMIEEVFEIHDFPTSLWQSVCCCSGYAHVRKTEREFGMSAVFSNFGGDHEIWGSLDYRTAESWTKLFVVPQSSVSKNWLGLGPMGADGSSYMFLNDEGFLLAYNPEKEEITNKDVPRIRVVTPVEGADSSRDFCRRVEIHSYVPSQISISSLVGAKV